MTEQVDQLRAEYLTLKQSHAELEAEFRTVTADFQKRISLSRRQLDKKNGEYQQAKREAESLAAAEELQRIADEQERAEREAKEQRRAEKLRRQQEAEEQQRRIAAAQAKAQQLLEAYKMKPVIDELVKLRQEVSSLRQPNGDPVQRNHLPVEGHENVS